MGVGLLTFVSADLQAVVAVNRGGQAFELAEAGVEIAKAHLADDPSPADWSSGELRVDGVDDNSVSIVVLRDGRDGFFKVVSTAGTMIRGARPKPSSPSAQPNRAAVCASLAFNDPPIAVLSLSFSASSLSSHST
jgi:hypothetical protein